MANFYNCLFVMETGWSTMAVNLEVEQMENTLPSKIMPGIMAERCQIL